MTSVLETVQMTECLNICKQKNQHGPVMYCHAKQCSWPPFAMVYSGRRV